MLNNYNCSFTSSEKLSISSIVTIFLCDIMYHTYKISSQPGVGRGAGGGRLRKKEKELMFTDNSVVIVEVEGGGRRYGRINGDGEKNKRK